MKLYMVYFQHQNQEDGLESVFSSREKAEEYVAYHTQQRIAKGWYYDENTFYIDDDYTLDKEYK